MSFDVTTLALAKSYADQHGGGGGDGASTAEKISYTNTDLPDVANVKTALDKVVKEQRGHGTDIEAINDMLGTLYKNPTVTPTKIHLTSFPTQTANSNIMALMSA